MIADELIRKVLGKSPAVFEAISEGGTGGISAPSTIRMRPVGVPASRQERVRRPTWLTFTQYAFPASRLSAVLYPSWKVKKRDVTIPEGFDVMLAAAMERLTVPTRFHPSWTV